MPFLGLLGGKGRYEWSSTGIVDCGGVNGVRGVTEDGYEGIVHEPCRHDISLGPGYQEVVWNARKLKRDIASDLLRQGIIGRGN